MQIYRTGTFTGGVQVRVTLSRRNLEQLLAVLDSPMAEPFLVRQCEDGTVLYVEPQENDVHYERREPGQGFEGII